MAASNTQYPWKAVDRSFRLLQDTRQFCDVCLSLHLDYPEERDPRVRIDFHRLVESAELGDCLYCALVYQSLVQHKAEISLDGYALITVHARKGKPFFMNWDDKNRGRRVLEIYKAKETCEIDELGAADDIADHPKDQTVLDRIRQWVKVCDETHVQCVYVPESPPLRLIDVGQGVDEQVRLTEDVNMGAKYIALSHVWGNQRSCISTVENMHTRLQGISWNELPATFQDAVTVTRLLKIRYVWIDSLCIIQNDRDDWEREYTKMGGIYGGAYLTVAACLSTSDEQGFLLQSEARRTYKSQPVLFNFCGQQFEGVRMRTPHDRRDQAAPEPLSTRGWTLQEKLLTTRLLSFSSGVTLECPQASLCECDEGLYPNPFVVGLAQSRFVDKNQLRKLLRAEHPDILALQTLWHENVVADYSDRSLTNPSDFLPALSALANAFQLSLDDRYLAGLWRSSLLVGFKWYNSRSSIYNRTSEFISDAAPVYRAPSWTWTSIDGPIGHYLLRHDTFHAQIIVVDCTPSTINPTGEVGRGFVQLRAPVVRVSLSMDKSPSKQLDPETPVHISRIPAGGIARAPVDWNFFDTIVAEAEAVSPAGESYTTIRRSQNQICASSRTGKGKTSLRSKFVSKLRRQSKGRRESERAGTATSSDTTDTISGKVMLVHLCEDVNGGQLWLLLGGMSEPPGTYQRIGIMRQYHGSLASKVLEERSMMILTIH